MNTTASLTEEVEPTFLGFGAFETTAFCTAIVVAAYSLISNPKGRQTGSDQAEYEVYAGWRLAVLAITAQIALMTAVIVSLSNQAGMTVRAALWVTALMTAPWAPLAGRVRQTLSAFSRVRRMMRARVTRNELAAVVRDRFLFGQRGIALPVIIYHAERILPEYPLAALRANKRLFKHEEALSKYADDAAQTSQGHALEMGSLWMMNQSLQPSSIPRRVYAWRRFLSTFDVLARCWTLNVVTLRVDPMPQIGSVFARARILDIADLLQQGGTISDSLMARTMAKKKYCRLCRLTTRATVEAYLESSERGHTDLRAKLWLRDIGMNWQGKYERIIDVMWEACFMDAGGDKVEYEEDDTSPSYGDRAKVTTNKTLALLWLIIRSTVHRDGEHPAYGSVVDVVKEGPFTRSWWDRFWTGTANRLSNTEEVMSEQVSANPASKFKATLRQLVDDDISAIVECLLQNPVDQLCGDAKCLLSDGKIILTRC